MHYQDHFRLADDYIAHLDQVIGGLSDPFIKSQYTGFLAISAVTVYELAIKTIFLEFANGKHKLLGSFANAYFARINGRIRVEVIRTDYIKKFGDKYLKRFNKKLETRERDILFSESASISASYANIITWRNQFAHEGIVSSTATYEEVRRAYFVGKNVIDCLAESMTR